MPQVDHAAPAGLGVGGRAHRAPHLSEPALARDESAGLPSVSICIPVYQGADYIGRAIRSVLDQTYHDFELVVRDNGSTDDTAEVIGSFDDPRIRIERQSATVPMVDNWNAAISLCRAPLVKVLCADDVLRPRCLEQQVAAMRADDRVALVAGRTDMIDGRDRVLVANRQLGGLLGRSSSGDVTRTVVRHGGNPIGPPPSVLFRRADFDALGGFDGTNLFTMDLDMWMRLLTRGDLVGIRDSVAGFRIHSGSASAAATRREFRMQRSFTRALVHTGRPDVRRTDRAIGVVGAYGALARRLALFGLGTVRSASSVVDADAQVAAATPRDAGSDDIVRADGVDDPVSFACSAAFQARLHRMVPGGAHTFAKGPDQYPEAMAPILVRGSGARVWDVDGNCFVEYGMGMRSVTLGHGYRPVVEAVRSAVLDGTSFSRPTELEVEAAQDFLSLVPGADMVKFAKNASDATSAAVRLARAATGRELVAYCGDQPYFGSHDLFVATLPIGAGVPESTRAVSHPFGYNDLDSLRAVLEENDRQVACVILEPATSLHEPAPGFLEGVRALCDQHGTVLIFDETITGFRWSTHGAQGVYGVTPDLSTWGKAIGNGFPIAALAGRRELMELGGLRTDRERVFLLSSTHGGETASLAAFRAVVRAYADTDPIVTMERQGAALAAAVNDVAAQAGIADHLSVAGRPSCLVFRTLDAGGAPSQTMRTLFLQEILRRGVLGQSYVISAAHTDADIERTVRAARGACTAYRMALETRRPEELFSGPPVAPAHRRYAEPRRVS